MFIAPRHLIFSLFYFFVFLVFETPAYAQPKINKIEAGEARPGEKIELALKGKDFQAIKRIEKVKIAELDVDIIDYKIQSNSQINVKIKIPQNARPGRHKIGFLVSGEGFSAWIESVVKTNTGNPQPEIEIEVDGHKIEGKQSIAVEFDETQVEKIITKRIRINNRGDAILKLDKLKLPPGIELDGEFPEKIQPNNSAFLYLKINTANPDLFNSKIAFNTNTANDKTFSIGFNKVEKTLPVPFASGENIIEPDRPTQNIPVIEKIEAADGRPNDEIILKLHGQQFNKVQGIKTVRIGEVDTPALDFAMESDRIASIEIHIPDKLLPGFYPLSFLVKAAGFEDWIKPTEFLTADNAMLVSEIPMLEVLAAVDNPAVIDRIGYPEITGIESSALVPGGKGELKISGKGLSGIAWVDSVKIGEVAAPVLDFTSGSDDGILVNIQIPYDISPGDYAIALLATVSGNKIWIKPKPKANQFLAISPLAGNKFILWLVRWLPFILPLLVAGGSYVAIKKGLIYKIVNKELLNTIKAKLSVRKFVFQFGPKKDVGTQSEQQTNPIQIAFAFTLKPITAPGKIVIKSEGKLIDADKVTYTKQFTSGKKKKEDDLTIIEGIGPKIRQLLHAHGITTFSTLAAKNANEIEKILDDAKLWIADPDTWPEQARLAAAGQWDKLKALKKELIAGREVK